MLSHRVPVNYETWVVCPRNKRTCTKRLFHQLHPRFLALDRRTSSPCSCCSCCSRSCSCFLVFLFFLLFLLVFLFLFLLVLLLLLLLFLFTTSYLITCLLQVLYRFLAGIYNHGWETIPSTIPSTTASQLCLQDWRLLVFLLLSDTRLLFRTSRIFKESCRILFVYALVFVCVGASIWHWNSETSQLYCQAHFWCHFL